MYRFEYVVKCDCGGGGIIATANQSSLEHEFKEERCDVCGVFFKVVEKITYKDNIIINVEVY